MRLLAILILAYPGLAQTRSVDLSWTASTSTNVTGYNVYRVDAVPPLLTYPPLSWVKIDSIAPATAYTDSAVTSSMVYLYSATAVDSNGNESGNSNIAVAVMDPSGPAPTCSAGASQTVSVGSPLTLNGSASIAGSGSIISYSWAVVASAAIGVTPQSLTFTPSSSVANPTVTGFVFGPANFQLTVMQTDGQQSSCVVHDGAVVVDANGNILPTGLGGGRLATTDTVATLIGSPPMIGKNPWPFYDQTNVLNAATQVGFIPTVYGDYWNTPGAGTITVTNNSFNIVGVGTSFTTDFCGGGTSGGAGRGIIVWYPANDGTGRFGRRLAGYPTNFGSGSTYVNACADDTHMTLATNAWGSVESPCLTGCSGLQYSIKGSAASQAPNEWDFGDAPAGYYESLSMVYYSLYFRTGIDTYLLYARTYSDRFISSPQMDLFNAFDLTPSGLFGWPVLFRDWSILGMVIRANDTSDGHPDLWPGLHKVWDSTIDWITRTGFPGNNITPGIDAREYGYGLAQLSYCALYDTDANYRLKCRNYIQAMFMTSGTIPGSSTWNGVPLNFLNVFPMREGSGPLFGAFPQLFARNGGASVGNQVVLTNGSASVSCSGTGCNWQASDFAPEPGYARTGYMWFYCGPGGGCTGLPPSNASGDTKAYCYQPGLNVSCTFVDANHFTLDRPYEGTSGTKSWLIGSSGMAGWGQEPFYLGILGFAFDIANKAMACALPGCDATTAAMSLQFLKDVGIWSIANSFDMNPGIYGFWYYRGYPGQCDNPNQNDYWCNGHNGPFAQREFAGDGFRGMQSYYQRTNDVNMKTPLDISYSCLFGSPSTGPIQTCPDNTWDSGFNPLCSGHICNKIWGQTYGFSAMFDWPAIRGTSPPPPPPPPLVSSYAASPTSIILGTSSTLSWVVSGATSISISPTVGAVAASGSATVSPTTTTTYTLTAIGLGGTTTALATVTVTAPPPPSVSSFTASPATILLGQSSTLAWTVTGSTGVSINQGIGTVAATGTRSVSPTVTTVYTLTAVGLGGTTTSVTTVTVTIPPPPVVTFTASPTSIVLGSSSTLSWTVTGSTSVSINQAIGTVAASGTRSVSPTTTTTYTLTAIGAGGTTTSLATVTVTLPPPPAVSFTASPTSILSGQSSTLSWTVTGSITSVSINQGIGTVSASGSTSVSPTVTTTYTLTAIGPGGTTTGVASVTVTPLPPVVSSFTATPTSIISGQSSSLSWVVTGSTSVSINQGIGVVSSTASRTVSPTVTTIYTLTAIGAGGTTTASVTVTVTGAPPPPPPPVVSSFTASPTTILLGQSSTLSWTVTGSTTVSISPTVGTVAASGSTSVSPTATTTYTLTAVGSGGTTTATAAVTVTPPPPPVVSSFTATASSIVVGQSSTLAWTVTGSTSVSINQGLGAVAASGTRSVSPTTTTTYTLTAIGTGGTTTASATVTVTPLPPAVSQFTASPGSIILAQSSTLAWTVTGSTSVSINQGIGSVTATGSTLVSPTATTTYTLTAVGPGGITTATATVTVTGAPPPPPPPIISSFTATPSSIILTRPTTLSWVVTGSTSVSINQGVGTVAATGTTAVSPAATTTYTLTAVGSGGTTTSVVTVTVTLVPPILSIEFGGIVTGK